MANQSAKRNTQKIKTPILLLTYAVYGITAWFALWNAYYLMSDQVAIWHFLLVCAISYINIFCLNAIKKYWAMQVPQAAEYHIDVLAMNAIVSLFDFWTHKVWHMYWLILAFVLFYAGKWLWAYITPKYEEKPEGEEGKKEKKEKKQRVKYIKK